ncbi:MAG: hypothetical protein HC896_14835 [Bacteroidales bacterium]|nr:hypothetical protein [Bacteroidales bacterium]
MPGWGYWIEQGATTLWESWDKNDSKNHVMYGHISEWFYANLAGIQPDEAAPGFKHFYVSPLFADGLTWASGQTLTPYGEIKSEWKRSENKVQLNITVPFNTTADILLPKQATIISENTGASQNKRLAQTARFYRWFWRLLH